MADFLINILIITLNTVVKTEKIIISYFKNEQINLAMHSHQDLPEHNTQKL